MHGIFQPTVLVYMKNFLLHLFFASATSFLDALLIMFWCIMNFILLSQSVMFSFGLLAVFEKVFLSTIIITSPLRAKSNSM